MIEINDYYQGVKLYNAKQRVIMSSMEVVSSRMWFDLHPEDPHGDASVGLADDMFDEAMVEYFDAKQALDQQK